MRDPRTPTDPFAARSHGICYSPLPSKFHSAPPQSPAKVAQFFDSDMCNDNFTAVWGTGGSCGRQDLETMQAAKFNLIRLYDYNYARGASSPGQPGNGHIEFLDKCESLGLKVVIPVSNWNFSNNQYAWPSIDTTLRNIVKSLEKGGSIHPAVHSFSVGNELDLSKYGLPDTTLIQRGIEVVTRLNSLAPDYYCTIPVSNANQAKYFGWFQKGNGAGVKPIPVNIYSTRFYNSVQTFQLRTGLVNQVLTPYDGASYNVPLLITELGFNKVNAGSEDKMVANVIEQATACERYLKQHATTQFKGYCIFQWQNANWKGGPSTSEANFGIHNYDGQLCTSHTGPYDGNSPCGPIPSAAYDVDKLAQRTSTTQGGLVTALTKIFG